MLTLCKHTTGLSMIWFLKWPRTSWAPPLGSLNHGLLEAEYAFVTGMPDEAQNNDIKELLH